MPSGHITPGAKAALAVGAVLAAFTLALGLFEGGKEGACYTETEFARAHREADRFRSDYSLLPPGRRCTAYAADGTRIAAQVYPELEDYALAALLFAVPLAVWGAGGLIRRRGSG